MRYALQATAEPNGAEDWQPAATAPFDRELQLAVLERGDAHSLVFPCRRAGRGWSDAQTGQRVDINPTHWRDWRQPLA